MEDGSNRRDGASESAEDGAAADAELVRLTIYADLQERKASGLQATVSQLQGALDSRVVIVGGAGNRRGDHDRPGENAA